MSDLGALIMPLVLLITILLAVSYVKSPPSTAFIISGISRIPRTLIGKGGLRIPFLERLDKLYLGQLTVDIKTDQPVPTNDFINVNVDAVAKIRVGLDNESLQIAAKNFLNMQPEEIAGELKDSLQGNLREIIGTLDLKTLNTDRDGFSDQVLKKATFDMKKLGIEIISCNIQNVTDEHGLIKDLGADNTAKIQKDAAITKANATKEVDIETAKAKKEANDARVAAETAIAEKNNELNIRKSELKKIADAKQAEADVAYELQKQESLMELNIRTVNADIEKTKREQELTQEAVKITENKLKAEVNKTTEAKAEAELFSRQKLADAELYELQKDAEAKKLEAEVKKYNMVQEAEGVKAIGEAEAEAIRLKGHAEAEAMEKKAEAYAKYDKAAIMEMMVSVLPQVAKSVSESISNIDSVNIYGGDINTMSNNVPIMIKQVMDTMKSTTGVDMSDIIKSNTIEAKTNRNFNLDINNNKNTNIEDTDELI